jgi:hypothetical protein
VNRRWCKQDYKGFKNGSNTESFLLLLWDEERASEFTPSEKKKKKKKKKKKNKQHRDMFRRNKEN